MKRFLQIPLLLAIPLALSAQVTTQNTLTFTENKGQVADENNGPLPNVLFTAELGGAKAFITRKGIHYVLDITEPDNQITTHRLDMEWLGANTNGGIQKINPVAGHQNFYLSHCPKGIFGVKSYESVLLEEVYPNIDVLLYSKDGFFEYDFLVKPGGNVWEIRIKYSGAEDDKLLENGDLVLMTPLGTLTEKAPVAFQDGKKIRTAFVRTHHPFSFGFAVEPIYDRNKLLIIDPVIKIWGTYYGGSQVDGATSLFTDNQGNVYMGGTTQSDNNIAMNGHQNTHKADNDAFVAKFDKNGKRLWATYYGGENNDRLVKIFPAGPAWFYLCGATFSDSAIATVNVHQTTKGGKGDPTDQDAFVAKFDTNGVLIWASYFGGYDEEITYGGSADAQSNVYISGSTKSPTGIGQNGFQDSYNDAFLPDAFLAKFDKNGILQWSTYYGSLFSHEYGLVATGSGGEVYLAGFTESDTIIAENGYKTTYEGDKDVFIAKFDGNGNRIWGTYFGGPSYDDLKDIAIDKKGNICITGYSQSPTGIAVGGYRTALVGSTDMYAAKFDSAGTPLWSTYYGGTEIDVPQSIFSDINNNVYISGTAESPSGITYHQQGTLAGNSDAFVVKFSETGTLNWGMYVGGDADDDGYATIDAAGIIYMAGTTTSATDISFKGHQPAKDGGTDAYLLKFSPTTTRMLPSQNQGVCAGTPALFNYQIIADLDTANTFVIELSDSMGDFKTPQSIAQKNGYASGTDSLSIVIPGGVSGSANYKIRLISTLPADTIESVNFTVKDKPIAKIEIADPVQCLTGNSYTFTDKSKGVINKWNWDLGDGFASQFQHPIISYTNDGNFTPLLKVTASNGCSDSTTTQVDVLPMPVSGFKVNNNQMCFKDNNFIFTDSSKGNIVNYHWNFGDNNLSSSRNSTKKYSVDGTYIVWHTVTEANSCKDSIATVIRVYPQPNTSAISGDTLVSGNSTRPYQVSATGAFYNWFVNNGVVQSGNGTPQVTVQWDNGTEGKVKVVETTNFGCVGDTVYLEVEISPLSVGETGHTALKLYPNPAQNYFSIDVQNATLAKVTCYDVLGKETQLLPTPDAAYDISLLRAGVYMVEVTTTTGQKWTARIVKQQQ